MFLDLNISTNNFFTVLCSQRFYVVMSKIYVTRRVLSKIKVESNVCRLKRTPPIDLFNSKN